MKNILGESGVIRNFLYSDSEKIRSISSQIFEGVSESFVLSKEESKSDSEEQKGKFANGRLLGDIFTQSTSSQELRFLEEADRKRSWVISARCDSVGVAKRRRSDTCGPTPPGGSMPEPNCFCQVI